jgi:outer membrane protein OmpA-like peptidoglycan-associated protein
VKGQSVTVAVLIGEKHRMTKTLDNDGKPMTFKDGEILVGLDYVTAKAVQNQMVTVKAADIADALASKGFIDLYGIYFDTDKTDVKPESSATLDEMASLMKIDRSLKLEVSGHTDNSGAKPHNLALSQGRADAVVKLLVSKYGIDPKRLVAKGYGDAKPIAANATEDGKAKNRRVELRKL